MTVVYKDINQLSQKASVAGTEKIEVSDTEYITPDQIRLCKTKIFYGTCSTGASTRVKVVTCPDISASDWSSGGALLYVKFSYTNTSGAPQLKISSGGTDYTFYISKVCNGELGTLVAKELTSIYPVLFFLASNGTNCYLVGPDTNTTYTIDSTPTSGSTNLITSGGVYDAIPSVPGGNAKIFYGTCNSDADYLTKTVVCSDFTSADLVKGALIFVTFDYTNNVDTEDVKLNVNNTGDIYIREPRAESNSISYLRYSKILQANCTYLFTFNGTFWVLLTGDSDKNDNTTYSVIGSSEAQTGTATTARTVSAASLKRDIEYRMAQNQSNWNESDSTSPGYIQNKPTIPTGLPAVSSSDNGKILQVSSGAWATVTPPTIPTNVSAFTNDANYVKYVLCADEAAYNAITTKDSGTLYLIPES